MATLAKPLTPAEAGRRDGKADGPLNPEAAARIARLLVKDSPRKSA